MQFALILYQPGAQMARGFPKKILNRQFIVEREKSLYNTQKAQERSKIS